MIPQDFSFNLTYEGLTNSVMTRQCLLGFTRASYCKDVPVIELYPTVLFPLRKKTPFLSLTIGHIF